MSFDNDDDLFDYEPEEDSPSNISIQNEPNNLSQTEQEFVDSIKSAENSVGSLNGVEARLAIAYINSSSAFISKEAGPSGHAYAMRYVLDELTDGRFSLLELFKSTEAKIIRLMAYISLSESIFGNDGTEFKEALNELFDVNVGDLHVRSTYYTHLAISRHSLIINRAIYSQLSEKLDMPCEPSLFDDQFDVDKLKITYFHLVNNIHSNIISELATEGLSTKVSEAFGQDVQLYKK